MLVLKLEYSEDIDFIIELRKLKSILKDKKINIGFVESIDHKTHIIKILCDDSSYDDRIKNIINLYVSNILYRVIIDKYKNKELLEYLTNNYFFLKQSEILELEKKIEKVLKCESIIPDENSVSYLNQINYIIEQIRECISERQEININGFITFRMKNFRNNIENIIESIIETYMARKEYEEFIKLLRYFVEMQVSTIEEVNIVISETNVYNIEDERGNNLYYKFIKELSENEKRSSDNIEDILITGLITNSPKEINIYDKYKKINEELLNTIKSVFVDRVNYFTDSTKEKKNVDIKK
ncbi:putative sporulation protein YtxC [Clostridium sp. BJN0001]|uniref:putative sporulation protein YtxC n=1 Tax=Clostridium sp. BJN0001 TaxID=2930219 RepID=UPI001FD55FFA|nr:putative sporulation protein YtxC [Clostridium sp. BJN0001]